MSPKKVRSKVAIKPSKEERKETLDTLTDGKAINEESAVSQQQPQLEKDVASLDRSAVEPGVGIVKQALRPKNDTALSDDQDNQQDSRADVLPR